MAVRGGISTPRFCSCALCPEGQSPPGCKGGINVHGLPEVDTNVNLDASEALRELVVTQPKAMWPCGAGYDPKRFPVAQWQANARCEALSTCSALVMPQAPSPFAGAGVGWVRWDEVGQFWVPTTVAGTNLSLGALATSMCPRAKPDARRWTRDMLANGGGIDTADEQCLCDAVRWAAVPHNLSHGVYPLISYPQDMCHCQPAPNATLKQAVLLPQGSPMLFDAAMATCMTSVFKALVYDGIPANTTVPTLSALKLAHDLNEVDCAGGDRRLSTTTGDDGRGDDDQCCHGDEIHACPGPHGS